MATITFVNNAPGGVPGFNPGLEEVLDPTGTITQHTANLFEITNTSGGPFNGFKFQLISHSSDDFGFNIIGGVVTPYAGRIDGIKVRAPDGTIITEVTGGAYGFGDYDLVDFNNQIFNLHPGDPKAAVFDALNQLLNNSNLVEGSAIADHATGFGLSFNFAELRGGNGDDVLWSPESLAAKLVGGAGNDVIRVEDGTYYVHGANADGTGGAGETNTLEIVGYVNNDSFADFHVVTDIDALRFVAGDQPVGASLEGAEMEVNFDAAQIGAGLVSPTLAVDGSTTASPLSRNHVSVVAKYDEQATSGVSLDLSGWTFTNWNDERIQVSIQANSATLALNDTIVGTTVGDEIDASYGDDTIRGGGGADHLDGGPGNDTFIYGLNEAAAGETVAGGETAQEGTADKILILADNDFSGAFLFGIDEFVFGGAATATFSQNFVYASGTFFGPSLSLAPTVIGSADVNRLALQLEKSGSRAPAIDLVDIAFKSWNDGVDKISITGTKSRDEIAGSSEDDLIRGAEGGDLLQGNQGGDVFVFDTGFGKGVDHIADFHRKEGDEIQLENAIFKKLKAGAVAKAAFTTGTEAHDQNDRIIYDKVDGVLRFDDDGIGKHKAFIFAMLDDAANLKAADFFVI